MTSVPAVRLVRTIPAPAADVFAAWTDARLLSRWLAAHECWVREARTDPRPGGAYHIAVVCPPDDDVHVTTGEYRELVPNARVVMTRRYAGPHGDDPTPSLLTVELRETAAAETELTLVHERARDARTRELLEAGWPTCLDKLADSVAAGDAVPAASAYRVTVMRRVPADPAAAFRAWSDPEAMRRWWTDVAEVEPRVGGRFRAESRGEGGARNVIVGEFLEFVPVERLVMTWRSDEPDVGGGEWLVRIDFVERGDGGTDVSVTETERRVAPEHAADPAESVAAWCGALELLAGHFGAVRRT